MSRLTDDDVRGLIKHMPRSEPSDDFTARVLDKLDLALARRAKRRAALAVIVVFAIAGLASFMSQHEASRSAERLETLRSEYRELQSELQKLRAIASELEPVLELGGTDEVDFVFDLREVERVQSQTQPVFHEESR